MTSLPTVSEAQVPARYHTGPDCWTAQLAPVGSIKGLWLTGIPNAQIHHMPPHSPYVLPKGCELGGTGVPPPLMANAGAAVSSRITPTARTAKPLRLIMVRLLCPDLVPGPI